MSRFTAVCGLLLVVLVAVAFLPALDVYLIGDDFEWLAAAYEIPKHPLTSFDRINSMCRPVVTWSFLANYLVFGPNAVAYMATNLLIHAVNAVLLFVLLTRMVRSPVLAAGAAAAFALSPLHSEAVLWASSRGDTLLLTSWFAALLFMGARRGSSDWRRAATVTFLVLIGAGAKESWVVFPFLATSFLILVLGYRPAAATRSLRWTWVALLLYLCVFVVVPAVRGESTPAYYADAGMVAAVSKVSRLLLMFCGLEGVQLTGAAAGVVAGAIAIAVVAWVVLTGNRPAQWAVTWTVCTLALAAPFPDIALRHNYLPLAGFWMTFALLGDAVIGEGGSGGGIRLRRTRGAVITAVIVGVLVIEGLTLQREIDDYRAYGELHRQLAEAFTPIGPAIPRDRPLLFLDLGTRKGVEETADLVKGFEKVFFVRPGAIWQLVFLPPLADFLSEPFVTLLRPVPEGEVATALTGDVTVLVFTDRGFGFAEGVPEGLAEDVASTGRLPDKVGLYRFGVN